MTEDNGPKFSGLRRIKMSTHLLHVRLDKHASTLTNFGKKNILNMPGRSVVASHLE